MIRHLYCVHIGGKGQPGTLVVYESSAQMAYWYERLGYYVERKT